MDHLSKLVAACCLTWAAAASAQTYQVGQYLGNMNDINRLTYNTMGSAAQHANYTAGGANWTTLAGQNAARMTGQATATIGGRTVLLTAASRVPLPAIVNAARGVAMMNPTTAAVTLLGAFAMDHWLAQSKIDWNRDPSTNLTHPFTKQVEKECTGSLCTQYGSGRVGGGHDWHWSLSAAVDATVLYAKARTNASRCENWTPVQPGVLLYNIACWTQGNDRFNVNEVVATRQLPDSIELLPLTWDAAEPELTNAAAKDYSAVDWKGVTEKLLRAGGSIDPGQITTTVTGPASQQGQRTERNLSNGDKSVTQTTHNYTYNNNNVTHNTTTTTTVTNVNNQVVSEESESTDNPVPDEPQPDLCEKNPDILACQKLGEPQTVELETQEREATITPESGFGGAGQCPAPRYIYPQGRTIAIPFYLFCMYAEGLRPVIIALSWVSAGIILIGARGGD